MSADVASPGAVEPAQADAPESFGSQATGSTGSVPQDGRSGETGQHQHNWEKRAKDAQRALSEMEKQLGALKARFDSGLSGDQIHGILANIERALQSGDEAKIRAAQALVLSGDIPELAAAKANEPDPYEDEAVTRLREQVLSIEKTLKGLSGQLATATTAQAETQILGKIERFMAEYPVNDEEKSAVVDRMTTELMATARQNPNALLTMNDRAFKSFMLPVLTDVVPLETLGERIAQRRNAQRTGASTDGPLRAATTGREEVSLPKPGQNLERSAANALREYRRRQGLPVT